MKLRCKQGDWAIVIKSWAGNEGKIVRCLRLATYREVLELRGPGSFLFEPHWIVDRYLPSLVKWSTGETEPGPGINIVLDEHLCPLPPDNEDSTPEQQSIIEGATA